MKSDRLTGDVAVVTGAASGIDRAIAIELARHGAVVACADLDDTGCTRTVDEITEAGGKAFGVHIDIGDAASVDRAFAEVFDRTGKITVLVNGAAVTRFSQLPECSDEEWNFVMNINLTGAFRCLRAVHPYMSRTGGRIVQISSTSGKSGGSWAGPHYVASKAGLIGLTKYAAGYFVKDGIRVNAICPGVTETPLTDQGEHTAATRAQQVSGVPMGRIGTPEDTAGVALFLVSDESRYITGITVDVTGGRYMYGN
ncbi:SDR family oxidoreductase [Pseudonocardia sp. C8]|uniref:SDR family NAD(P)-dependent oxidoreductase n=1 Tax=Pseudonocardia sp. C8 TaxID=2762759 RepID=UPI001642DD6D|nr:SDR family NAD(P)-dependent oxidoreductase [Pseudonocardia sp. C8]MBC3190325.1 SDR family oxidoreductase [Pseudonocardia sp. C8]